MTRTTSADQWSAANIFFTLATVSLGTYILWVGSSILIPIILASLVWFALVSVARVLQAIGPGFPGKAFLSHLVSWLVFILASQMIYSVVSGTVVEFTAELPFYEERLKQLAKGLQELFQGRLSFLSVEVPDFSEIVANGSETLRSFVPQLAGTLFSATQSGIVLVSTVLIYLIFFYAESSSFPEKLRALNREEQDQQRWATLIGFLISRMSAYIRIKTLTSALTGGLGLILMLVLGVNFAILFALFLFLLNYIPTIGSLISSLLPIVLYLVDPSATVAKWIILAGGLLLIQQSIGSVLEPRLLSNSFNISSILVMASLLFWGSIWGVFGMLISAPITAAIVILLANFRGSRQLAILLSADGKIDSLRPGA